MARRWSLNITPTERIGRIVVGAAAITAGIVLLFQSRASEWPHWKYC